MRNFEVYADGQPVRYEFSRTKELFAYLVDRAGAADVFLKTRNNFAVARDAMDCDYYRFLSGDTSVSMELFSLLRDWLIQHIQEKDTQYAPILLKRGVKKSWLQKFW